MFDAIKVTSTLGQATKQSLGYLYFQVQINNTALLDKQSYAYSQEQLQFFPSQTGFTPTLLYAIKHHQHSSEDE